jgi:hypothetical protein
MSAAAEGSSLLDLFGSLFNRNQASQAENQFWKIGDPYRAQLENITNNPDAYFKGPIAQELARQADTRYSSQFGNPAGSGTAQALSLQAMLNGYGSERDRLAQEGGLNYLNAAYPAFRANKMNAGNDIFGSLQNMLGAFTGGGDGGVDPSALMGLPG